MNDLGFLDRTRSSYDAVAAGHSTLFADALPGQPVERSMLALFAELASGRTADVGCGPGHVTAFLRAQGLDVFGVDLSPGMVEQARANYPELRFEVGSMTGLDHPDRSLSGLNAWFSTIHVPDQELPGVLAEFHRVLIPGAPLMLAFQVGDDPKHFAEAWGPTEPVTAAPLPAGGCLLPRRAGWVAADGRAAGHQQPNPVRTTDPRVLELPRHRSQRSTTADSARTPTGVRRQARAAPQSREPEYRV